MGYNERRGSRYGSLGERRRETETESPAAVLDRLSSLDKFKRVGKDSYKACCPAHNDRNPSLTITDVGDKILVHCFSGCTQDEVISALKDQGLWAKGSSRWVQTFSKDNLDYMMHWCLCYHGAFRRGERLADMNPDTLDKYVNALRDFSPWRYKIVEEDAHRV